jgi:endonuclease YncB( thermonuclease family)
MIRAALFLFAVLLPTAALAQDLVAGRASVVDGDSLEIHGARIRIHGIDAPESGQWCSRDQIAYRCGQEAAFALADKIGLKVVSCVRRDTDRYGRMMAVCTAGGEDLGGWLVSQGYAIAFRRYSLEYVATEDCAREARRGLWAGEFEKPEDFRRQGRTASRMRQPHGPAVRHACICPGDVDAAGRRCGGRSAFSRKGGASPMCDGRL